MRSYLVLPLMLLFVACSSNPPVHESSGGAAKQNSLDNSSEQKSRTSREERNRQLFQQMDEAIDQLEENVWKVKEVIGKQNRSVQEMYEKTKSQTSRDEEDIENDDDTKTLRRQMSQAKRKLYLDIIASIQDAVLVTHKAISELRRIRNIAYELDTNAGDKASEVDPVTRDQLLRAQNRLREVANAAVNAISECQDELQYMQTAESYFKALTGS